jgi:hypothetical protein
VEADNGRAGTEEAGTMLVRQPYMTKSPYQNESKNNYSKLEGYSILTSVIHWNFAFALMLSSRRYLDKPKTN